MINIGTVITTPHGACSYYRSIGPLSKIKSFNLKNLEKANWVNYSSIDILYLERPVLPSFLEGIKMAKNFSIPVWVDFDDDLFSLPRHNPAYDFYSKQETQNILKECCMLADVITVTSQKLYNVFSKINKNVHIIPNAWNDYNFKWNGNFSSKKIINWRGSATHRGDLLEYKSAFSNLQKKKDWTWSFMGKEHWIVSDYIDEKQKLSFDESDIISYFNTLKRLEPSIQIVPLEFCDFNEAKSNISWIEGTYAGAVAIAPDMEQWRKPGICLYSDVLSFQSQIEEIMNNDKYRKKLWKDSWEFIEQNLLLSKINKKREEVATSLL